MFTIIAEVVICIVMSISIIVVLDYIAGLDKCKPLIAALQTNITEAISFGVIVVFGIVHGLGLFVDNNVVQDISTFYITIAWVAVWIKHTVIIGHKTITNIRQYCLQKRNQPS